MVTGMEGDRARSALGRTRFGEIRWVTETGSTNLDLLALAEAGASDGVVLVADHQTAGRGRLDRTWESPPGSSLLVSILLRPSIEPDQTFLLTAATGVAAAEACAAVASLNPGIKWPNDLVVVAGERYEGHKLGGILAEGVIEGGDLAAVVVGLGLNLNWSGDLPSELTGIAVALNQVVDHEVEREELLVELLCRLDHWLDAVATGEGRERLITRYRALSATLGRKVRVTMPDATFEGEAVDITPLGHLLVAVEGEESPREVLAGDVVHLRHG